MVNPTLDSGETRNFRLLSVLRAAFHLEAERIDRIHGGTASDNFVATTGNGVRWFVKIYRAGSDALDAEAAIELTEFAEQGGIPVPRLRRSRRGDTVTTSDGFALSVWEFIDADTAEGGLRGHRWRSLGCVVGRLHRHLATHPSGRPTLAAPVHLLDIASSTARYDRLIEEYLRQDSTDDVFVQWAVDALLERRALLPVVLDLLQRLPPLTMQTLHGDLAAPNVLLRGDDVAAVIDFQPPSHGFLAWEIARIACDPRTLVTNPRWCEGLSVFLDAYRAAHPAVQPADLASVLAVGCAYTIASTYPLSALVHRADTVNQSLEAYGQQRHRAALTMLDTALRP